MDEKFEPAIPPDVTPDKIRAHHAQLMEGANAIAQQDAYDFANSEARRLMTAGIFKLMLEPSPWLRLVEQGDTPDELWLAQCKAAEGWPIPPYELRACIRRILNANDEDTKEYNRNGFRRPHELELGSGLWSAAPLYDIIENDPDY